MYSYKQWDVVTGVLSTSFGCSCSISMLPLCLSWLSLQQVMCRQANAKYQELKDIFINFIIYLLSIFQLNKNIWQLSLNQTAAGSQV